MIKYLNRYEKEEIPLWLQTYRPGCALDFDEIRVSRCVYYPGAGSDGMPVEICNKSHCAHLYIYADYWYGDSNIYPDGLKTKARGYNIIDRRPLQDFSKISWTPHVPKEQFRDGEPDNAIIGKYQPSFELVVYEREEHLSERHGAKRFAVIFCTYDGIALYDILFSNKIFTNLFLLLLQDHGLGGNYASFRGLMQEVAINSATFPKYCIAQMYCNNYDGVWSGYKYLGCSTVTSYPRFRPRTLYKDLGICRSNYVYQLWEGENLNIQLAVSAARNLLPDEFKSIPWTYRDSEGRTLEHGTAVLETEMQCNAYLAAYGLMHYKKLERAFDAREFPFQELNGGIEVYDWGCGQGIGTIALIDKFRERGILSLLKKITLEEPSDVARSRAVFHVNMAIGNPKVKIVEDSSFLPSDGDCTNCIESINVEQPFAIHIFSNVLDIEKVSLKGVSRLITSSGNKHIVLCVGPASLNEDRINSFKNYFKSEGIQVFTEFRNVDFGRHPNGRAYGCLIKGFSFNLSRVEDVLHEYHYFAPKQLYCLYGEAINGQNLEEAAFEISAPFDLSIHKNLHPVYALISNLISRGCPTLASARIYNAIHSHSQGRKGKELKTISRIHKTLIEALISGRFSIDNDEWQILVVEDGTDTAQIAIEDFYELFHHLVKMTENYDNMVLPTPKVYSKVSADTKKEYDIIIDVSADKFTDFQNIEFSKYKAKNDCYFIVRSSNDLYETRTLYTTERIKYKPFVEKDCRGIYIADEELAGHLRYFLNLIFTKEDFRPGQLSILSRALQLKSVIGLLPTGGGKSLTYQLAAMLQPAVTLVVDPLKGLMKDQYDGLRRTGIDCISYINSDVTQNREEGLRREAELTGSQVQIMFLSPERLSIRRFREVLRSMHESEIYFAYGVIDEVHCVSEWGHDFRLAYLHLGRNLYNYVLPKDVEGEDNHISLFGLTATASFDVLADVERELSGRKAFSLEDDATVRYENTNRLELQYNVYPVDASNVEKDRTLVIKSCKDVVTNVNDTAEAIKSDVSSVIKSLQVKLWVSIGLNIIVVILLIIMQLIK